MKFALPIATTIAVIGFANMAVAADKPSTAMGLAVVIAQADPCGFKLDASAVEKYTADQGLDEPSTLLSMENTIYFQRKSPSSLGQCALAKATAKKLAILAQ